MKVPFAQFSLLCLLLAAFNAGAGEVRIVTNAAGEHTLLRDAVPYTVRGACCPVETTVGELVAAGGNSVRTYGKEIERILPMARKYNLSIMLGLPIKRERDGFNYEDSAAVEAQFLEMREWVRRYRNEPNLLMWAIGNEPELAARNTVPLWREVNRLARMIREEDSRHPIITVLAGFDERKIREVLKHCPELDALGINDYGPAKDWPDELRRYGWIKPYLHTEFGPLGYWPGPHNRPPTAWGAAVEQTSSEKAELYAENWLNAVTRRPGQSFGGYAFMWSWKQEHTHTWYSMFMPTGERTELVDAMRLAWTGQPHPHPAPRITRFATEQPLDALTPGQSINVHLDWTCDRPVRLHVEARHVPPVFSVGGDFEELPDILPDTSWQTTATGVSITAPSTPGEYRIFLYIKTDDSTVATANLPILVKSL